MGSLNQDKNLNTGSDADETSYDGTIDIKTAIEDNTADNSAHIANPTAAHAATAVSFTPTPTIGAMNVQAAIAELGTNPGNPGGVLTRAIWRATDVVEIFPGLASVSFEGFPDTGIWENVKGESEWLNMVQDGSTGDLTPLGGERYNPTSAQWGGVSYRGTNFEDYHTLNYVGPTLGDFVMFGVTRDDGAVGDNLPSPNSEIFGGQGSSDMVLMINAQNNSLELYDETGFGNLLAEVPLPVPAGNFFVWSLRHTNTETILAAWDGGTSYNSESTMGNVDFSGNAWVGAGENFQSPSSWLLLDIFRGSLTNAQHDAWFAALIDGLNYIPYLSSTTDALTPQPNASYRPGPESCHVVPVAALKGGDAFDTVFHEGVYQPDGYFHGVSLLDPSEGWWVVSVNITLENFTAGTVVYSFPGFESPLPVYMYDFVSPVPTQGNIHVLTGVDPIAISDTWVVFMPGQGPASISPIGLSFLGTDSEDIIISYGICAWTQLSREVIQ
jgi:hypothetical protein